jgi:hypothetical protein
VQAQPVTFGGGGLGGVSDGGGGVGVGGAGVGLHSLCSVLQLLKLPVSLLSHLLLLVHAKPHGFPSFEHLLVPPFFFSQVNSPLLCFLHSKFVVFFTSMVKWAWDTAGAETGGSPEI